MIKFLKAVAALLLIIAVVFVPYKLYDGLNTDTITDEMLRRREKYYYGVIEIWQIDCFEGGTGSRGNWLKNITAGFEKKNNGVYVNVETVSAEMALKLITTGQKKPDMLSFGAGLEIEPQLFEKHTLQPEKLIGCVSEYAVPWCMGAYFMIGEGDTALWGNDGRTVTGKKATQTIYSVGISKQNGHSPLSALLNYGVTSLNGENAAFTSDTASVFDAYNYSYKVNSMLGTQRDLYRLKTAQSREKERQGTVTNLMYTDLFQYIGILKCDNEKKISTMNSFIEYLIDAGQQAQLGSIGMFPVITEASPSYENEYMTNAWAQIKQNGIKYESYLFNPAGAANEHDRLLAQMEKTAEY